MSALYEAVEAALLARTDPENAKKQQRRQAATKKGLGPQAPRYSDDEAEGENEGLSEARFDDRNSMRGVKAEGMAPRYPAKGDENLPELRFGEGAPDEEGSEAEGYSDEEADDILGRAKGLVKENRPRPAAEPEDREARDVGEAASPVDGGRAAEDPADDTSPEAEEALKKQLLTDFEVTHGSAYDVKSDADRVKMFQLLQARQQHPDDTPTQLALRIYRGEFGD